MPGNARFVAFVAISLVVFVWVLRLALGAGEWSSKRRTIAWVALVVIAGGMLLGRFGARAGLPWWIYYLVPALATLLLPPFALRMRTRQVLRYLVLATVMAPAIHLTFSFALGWKEYMPFWEVPAWWELLG